VMVYDGLPRATWLASSVADKRRLLFEIAERQLAAMAEAWELDLDQLHAARRGLVDGYRTIFEPVGDAAVELGDLRPHLELARWRATAPADRLAIARAVAAHTRASGRDIGEPELTGVDGVVKVWMGNCALVLVPGGQFRRGFDAAQLARLDRVLPDLWSRDGAPDRFPRLLTPFGADGPWPIDRGETIAVAPMWMAAELVDVTDEPAPWDHEAPAGHVRWHRVRELLGAWRMSLPTSDELLWAASAGDDRLFPWGDDASPIADLLGHASASLEAMYLPDIEAPAPLDRDPFAVFGSANAFGIVAALSEATWCAPATEPDDPMPMVHVGGALGFHPWQGGWEAMLFLTRVASRSGFDGRNGAARRSLRPIIRLA